MKYTIDSRDYSDKMHADKMIHCNDLWMIVRAIKAGKNSKSDIKLLIKQHGVEHLFKE